jgi:AcrR family transcriptional regulator
MCREKSTPRRERCSSGDGTFGTVSDPTSRRQRARGTAGSEHAPEGRRRRARKGDEKEAAILETAEALLHERAANQIKVEDLARGAGISRSTFYFYFDSVEAVIRALRPVGVEMYTALADALFPVDGDRRGSIHSAITAFLQVWRADGAVLREISHIHANDPHMRVFWEDVTSTLYRRAGHRITLERRAGIAPPGPPPAVLAEALVAMLWRAGYEQSLRDPDTRSEQRMTNTLTTVWMRSLYGTDDVD